jgi:hypothetical protein
MYKTQLISITQGVSAKQDYHPDLAHDLQELLLIAHRIEDDTDRRAIADIAEKWLRKLPIEKK